MCLGTLGPEFLSSERLLLQRKQSQLPIQLASFEHDRLEHGTVAALMAGCAGHPDMVVAVRLNGCAAHTHRELHGFELPKFHGIRKCTGGSGMPDSCWLWLTVSPLIMRSFLRVKAERAILGPGQQTGLSRVRRLL